MMRKEMDNHINKILGIPSRYDKQKLRFAESLISLGDLY